MTSDALPRPPGRVIVLNGASSSGKSTLARRLQDSLDTPFLLLSADQLIEAGVLPGRRDTVGPFAWVDEMRPRFFDRREAARGDRTPGEGRAHIEQNRIHDHGHHDLHIDTTAAWSSAVTPAGRRRQPTTRWPARRSSSDASPS